MQINQKEYGKIHYWVKKTLGKAGKCSKDLSHTAKIFQWANISHKYLYEISDWMELCPSCHSKYDATPEGRKRKSEARMGIPRRQREVRQLSKDGQLIQVFKSVLDVKRTIGISNTAINNVLHGRARTAGGYRWL